MNAKYLNIMILSLLTLWSCKEGGRFEFGSNDSQAPSPPKFVDYKSFNGGVRIFFEVPDDPDLLSINAEFKVASGETARFSVSYFSDSIDVHGLPDTLDHEVTLFSLDRAGNKSTLVPVPVRALEPLTSKVLKSLKVKPAFGSFFLNWNNELEQSINVFVNFVFDANGTKRDLTQVFSSNAETARVFIKDLDNVTAPISVKIRVEDRYGNKSATKDTSIVLYEDILIPKDKWYLPAPRDSVFGVTQCDGNRYEGRMERVIDGIINVSDEAQYLNTANSYSFQGGVFNGWDLIIDLGDRYELSRIVTHQRRFQYEADPYSKGALYGVYNVGLYNLYILNEESQEWEFVSQQKIPIPTGMDADIIRAGIAGDMCFFYPDAPTFTKPTRYLRYQALKCFLNNYTDNQVYCLAELTLYGRKAQ